MNATTDVKTQEKAMMQDKLQSLLNSAGARNQHALLNIERDNSLITDALVDVPRLTFDVGVNTKGVEALTVETDNNLFFNNHSLNQISEKFSIPAKYTRQLQETDWGRELSKDIFNETRQHLNKKVLIRSVGDVARGVVSDRFRRMDTGRMYNTFIKGMGAHGAVFTEAAWSETKVHMKCIYPQVFEVETPNNGKVYMVFGVRLRDSSFGGAKMEVNAFSLNVRCLNGWIGEKFIDQVHIGKALGDAQGQLSQATYDLYTDAAVSAINDILGSTLSVPSIQARITNIQRLSGEEVDLKKELEILPKIGFTKLEIETTEKKLFQNNPDDGVQGAPTKWKMLQAITAAAHDAEAVRKPELEELAASYAAS